MRKVKIGGLEVGGLCIGGNPFSGFSHQSDERTREMLAYYTPDGILDALSRSEKAGINTCFMRTDDHIFDIFRRHRESGGSLQWFAQVSQEADDPESWKKWLKGAAELGASALYIHGGLTDFWYAHKNFDQFREAVDMMRGTGVAAVGFAGHNPEAHAWIRDNLDVDFQMCSHYNPTDRSDDPKHQAAGEKWDDNDRSLMLEVIESIKTPVVHYKVFAAGNKPIIPAFELLGRVMKDNHVTVVGIYLGDDQEMIEKDIALFEKYVDGKDVGES